MKKSLHLSIICIIMAFYPLSNVIGQTSVYHSFPDSNAVWVVQAEGCCVNSCPPPPTPNPVITDHNISYYIQGDTLLNSTNYHKIYQSGSIYHHCLFGASVNQWEQVGPDYIGAIRQDTSLKQVYYLQFNTTQECVLYDFNLSVGDTINTGCLGNIGNCAIVTSIDSIMIGATFRKRFNLSTSPPYSLIEGLGSTAGFYEPLCPFEYTANLLCFSQNGQTLYPDTVSNCSIITSIQEPLEDELTMVIPNPFKFEATLNNGTSFIGNYLKIYNSIGGTIRLIPIKNSITKIERENLKDGVYFYQSINSNGTVLSGIFIVN